ncbi:GvpL/GvpF family gas vesicle protein [Paracoccaceae bacterium Fryx2]|jgi:hypothetical protein|nr:GvpL/GvpF family gas vesicle protein [Paracoccaceae bacterium Fryx2]
MTAAAEMNTTGNAGLYVCAIVAAPESSVALRQCVTDAPGDIRLIGQGGFSAVVMVPTADAIVSRDRQELVRQLLIHQQLVESFMAVAPVLPVKFATLAPDRESVELGLKRGRAQFVAAFDSLSGKTQFEIIVTWDVAAVFAEIANEPSVAALKAELAATAGGAGPEGWEPLGRLVKATLDQRRAETGKVLLDALSQVGVDSVVNPILDDSMILNLALLVASDKADLLDQCLEDLDTAFHGALSFRCVGPLPPHSFATVEITFLEPARIKHACSLLELDSPRSSDEVRYAYHRLARLAHPDATTDQYEGAGIPVLKDAYRTLLSFVDAGGPVVVSVQRQEAATHAG